MLITNAIVYREKRRRPPLSAAIVERSEGFNMRAIQPAFTIVCGCPERRILAVFTLIKSGRITRDSGRITIREKPRVDLFCSLCIR